MRFIIIVPTAKCIVWLILFCMAFIVVRSGGFWRKRGHITLREVKTLRFWKWRRFIKSERYIKKSKVLVITGGPGAGKTRELEKLFRRARDIWNKEAVYIRVGESLENWFKRAGLSKEELKGLKQFEKLERLIEVCKGKVVLLDDIDRAESKVKSEAVKWLVRVADVVVVSCVLPDRVNDSVEAELRKKLRLKPYKSMNEYVVDLGRYEVEVKDVGMIVAIVLIVFVAFAWGLTYGLLGALAFRYITAEGRRF